MCGIAGIYGSFRSQMEIRSALEAMNSAQIHRGPDENGLCVARDFGAGLASRRLSIVDLEHGKQPVPNEDGTIHCVLNGEIYNHNDLRETLQAHGHRFRSRCDTEVVVHAYEQWGDSFLKHLHGMFALAVLDFRKRRLLLARDGPGMKPLYYHEGRDGLVFASEVKALFATGWISPQPNPEAIDVFLAVGLVPSPLTAFKGVSKLQPGEFLTIGTSGLNRDFFWRFHYNNREPKRSDKEYADELEAILIRAVRSHLAADVPVGAFLSGGWDSSLVAAFAAQHAGNRLQTFSLVFPDSPRVDESRYARLVAERLETDHHEIEYSAGSVVQQMPHLVRHLEEPFDSGPAALSYQLASLAVAHVKTVMSGEGADELFGGYEWMRLNWPYFVRRITPAWFIRLVLPHVRKRRWRRALLVFGSRTVVEADTEWRRTLVPDEKRELLKPEFSGGPDIAPVILSPDILSTCSDSLQRRLAHDFTARLSEGILFAEDKVTMAHSLEQRMPFLDRSVVEFALRLPSRLKIRNGREKVILSHLARRHLPTEIFQRRKKGLGYPGRTWTRGPIAEYGRQVLMDAGDSPFNRKALETWIRTRPNDGRISRLIWLQCWWNEFIAASAARPRQSLSR